jgi:sensor histidine kinase YesM
MVTRKTLRKLVWLAVYTSPVISALIITPVFVFNGSHHDLYVPSLLYITIGVLLMWLQNITITAVNGRLATGSQNRTITIVVSYMVCVVVNLLLVEHFFDTYFGSGAGMHYKAMHFHLIIFVSINTAILILQGITLVREKNAAIQLENALLKTKHVEAINEQLKQQVQPHFLFNSLSTLKALIKSSPGNAEEYLVKLSDFLRFSVSSSGLNTVKLADELRLCADYLEMQKIRFGNALHYIIEIDKQEQDKYHVPVFAVQLLVENAIKHNAFTKEAPLHIEISMHDTTIAVCNNLQPKTLPEDSGGTGLANLRERYRLLSGDEVKAGVKDSTFCVSIKALEHEDSHNRR